MSIHKSKGLEFPVVFLCGLSRSFNQESTRAQVLCDKELGLGLSCVDTKLRVRYPSVAKSAIAAKMTADSISEEMRVLYVAMTRPKDRLIMTYAVKNLEADLEDIALRYDLSPRRLLTAEVDCPGGWVLQTAMKRTEAGAFFDLGENPNHTKVQDHPWLIQVNEGTADEAVLGDLADESRKTLSPDICEKIRASLNFNYEHESAVSAPSKQTATQLKGRDVDQEIAEDTRDRLPSIHKFRRPGFAKAQQQGIEYGNAIHIVMQHIRYEACAEPAGITAEIQRMVTDSLLTSEQAQMVDVETISNLFATEIGKKLLCTKNILREFKFSILDDGEHYIRGMKDEQILLQGVVDCALVEPDGITVIDFKTDYVTEETLNIVAARYRSQVQVYAHALERIYQKNVNSVLLYFFRLGRFVALDV